MKDPKTLKMTVIIEDDDKITTIEYEKVRELYEEATYSPPREWPPFTAEDGAKRVINPPEVEKVEISFTPLRDEEGVWRKIEVRDK